MRTPEEIQEAHDILISALNVAHTDATVADAILQKVSECNIDALCWVLGHERGEYFQKNLTDLKELMNSLGHQPVTKNMLQGDRSHIN